MKRDIMYGVAKCIGSPAVTSAIAKEVKEEINRVDGRLIAVEE